MNELARDDVDALIRGEIEESIDWRCARSSSVDHDSASEPIELSRSLDDDDDDDVDVERCIGVASALALPPLAISCS